jgi:hypothetical protein
MGRIRAASLVLAALAVGLLLAACGGGSNELLPGTTADQITSNLDQVRVSYEEGACEKAEDGVAKVSTEVDELGKVDAKLKKALVHGAAKLSQVVGNCGAAEAAEEEQAAEEEAEEEEQAQLESEELAEEEEQAFEKEQKAEERVEEEKSQEKAEKHAEQPGPPEEGEESAGEAKGHEKQEETVEPPIEGEEEVTPPTTGGGGAGGIGPGAEVEGGP